MVSWLRESAAPPAFTIQSVGKTVRYADGAARRLCAGATECIGVEVATLPIAEAAIAANGDAAFIIREPMSSSRKQCGADAAEV
jgi:hypothetical protein